MRNYKRVFEKGNLVGFIARVGAVDGVWNDYTPMGFMIQRCKDSIASPEAEKFEDFIYKTRGEAKRALINIDSN